MQRLPILMATAALALSPAVALAAPTYLYTSGHGDLAIAYEDGAFDPHIHSDDAVINGIVQPDEEFPLDDTWLVTAAQFTRPMMDFGFFTGLGVAPGESVYWLPQGNADAASFNAPFFGIEFEADEGVFVGNSIMLSLVSVDSPSGTGVFSLWKDGFPPNFIMSSADGIDGSDQLQLFLGHDHYNMGFTEAGLWGINLQAIGDLVAGGQASSDFTLFVNAGATVVPLPAAGWLLLSGLAMLARLRRRSLATV